jgi:hypothetical protein
MVETTSIKLARALQPADISTKAPNDGCVRVAPLE